MTRPVTDLDILSRARRILTPPGAWYPVPFDGCQDAQGRPLMAGDPKAARWGIWAALVRAALDLGVPSGRDTVAVATKARTLLHDELVACGATRHGTAVHEHAEGRTQEEVLKLFDDTIAHLDPIALTVYPPVAQQPVDPPAKSRDTLPAGLPPFASPAHAIRELLNDAREVNDRGEEGEIHPLVAQAQRELEAHLQGLIRATIPKLTPAQVEVMTEVRDTGNPRPRYRTNGSRRASLAGMTRATAWLRTLGLIVPPRDDGPNTWTLSTLGREALNLALARKKGTL